MGWKRCRKITSAAQMDEDMFVTVPDESTSDDVTEFKPSAEPLPEASRAKALDEPQIAAATSAPDGSTVIHYFNRSLSALPSIQA